MQQHDRLTLKDWNRAQEFGRLLKQAALPKCYQSEGALQQLRWRQSEFNTSQRREALQSAQMICCDSRFAHSEQAAAEELAEALQRDAATAD